MILRILLLFLALNTIACQRNFDDKSTHVDNPEAVQCSTAHGEAKSSRAGIVNGKLMAAQDPLASRLVLVRPKIDGTVAHCTGSLLPGGVILTASHCIQGDLSEMDVVLPSSTSCEGDVRKVSAVKVHPLKKNSDGSTNRLHDLALIRFSGTVPANYQTVALARTDLSLDPQESMIMVGFGVTNYEREDSGTLRVVTQPASRLGTDSFSSAYQVEQFSGGVCSGDSGGPLIVYRNSVPVVIGVASAVRNPNSKLASERCEAYSLYTPVDKNRDWIRKAHAQLTGSATQP